MLAAAQTLELYRDVCRLELVAEQLYDAGDAVEADIAKVRATRRHATNAIVELFAALHKRNQSTKHRILRSPNGSVPWPADWDKRHFNACNEPCDMLIGPCICGTWHDEAEPWVQVLLVKYNAEIVDS